MYRNLIVFLTNSWADAEARFSQVGALRKDYCSCLRVLDVVAGGKRGGRRCWSRQGQGQRDEASPSLSARDPGVVGRAAVRRRVCLKSPRWGFSGSGHHRSGRPVTPTETSLS